MLMEKQPILPFMAGAQYVYRFDQLLFMPSDLTSGVGYNRDALEDNMWGATTGTRNKPST